MFVNAYLSTAKTLLDEYNGHDPFHLYLKKKYGVLKNLGSRDRRYITQLCYSWFRAGHGLIHINQTEQFIYALFLCSETANALLKKLDVQLYEASEKSILEKAEIVEQRVGFQLLNLFPWNAELSPQINPDAFNQSFLIQPHLYVRLRPGKEDKTLHALEKAGIGIEKISPRTIAIRNGANVDALLTLDNEAVVQDKNSQRIIELLQAYGHLKKFSVWDCCAASGGKSLLLWDSFSNVHITVSDVRESILDNLRQRFQRAGIKNYTSFVGDAAVGAPPHHQKFDVILCDVPCSGSGTWSRTPEQLHYFDEKKINSYAQLQQRIVQNVARFLKPNGLLLYSTCSVFKKENEDVVQTIVADGKLKLLESTYYKGYAEKADTLFAALFTAL